MNRIVLDNDSRDYLDWRQGSGNTVEIFDIVVGSERGVGKGRKLVNLLYSQVDKTVGLVFAITRDSNEIAKQFYLHIEFRRIGRLARFYPDTDEDAIMYGRNI